MIKTVLGYMKEKALGITLPHEHICCFSEYADLEYVNILPQLPKSLADKLMVQNPMRMLTCK